MDIREPRLIMVLGTSPAVVTETLYELEAKHSFKCGIKQVELITTKSGKEKSEAILEEKLKKFAEDYFTSTVKVNWHVVTDPPSGQPLDDIVTDSDSGSAAELVLDVVRQHCLDESCYVAASLAGGRKTMSYFMGLAMSLYARNEDKLFHVLVPPELEKFDSGFFYPFPGQASPIELSELPFLRLRGYLVQKAPDLYKRTTTYREIIDAANQALGPSLPPEFTLFVDTVEQKVWIDGVNIPPIKVDPRFAKLFGTLVKLKSKPLTLEELLSDAPYPKADSRNFTNYLPDLNRLLEQHFGQRARILSTGGGRGRPAKYSLPPGMRVDEASSRFNQS